jgi:hypothetical protein
MLAVIDMPENPVLTVLVETLFAVAAKDIIFDLPIRSDCNPSRHQDRVRLLGSRVPAHLVQGSRHKVASPNNLCL